MWFTETPWPPVYICIALAVLLFAAWYKNHRGSYVVGIAALGALAVSIYAVEKLVVTDAEQVEARIGELTDALIAGDEQAVLPFIADPDVRNKIESAMQLYRVQAGLRITDFHAKPADDEVTLVSYFRANGSVAVQGGGFVTPRIPTRWNLSWRKDADGKWKVVAIQRLHTFTGEPMELLESER